MSGAEPRARLALGFGDFAGGHLKRDLGAAFLPASAARQRREIEPFMCFDQVDRQLAALAHGTPAAQLSGLDEEPLRARLENLARPPRHAPD